MERGKKNDGRGRGREEEKDWGEKRRGEGRKFKRRREERMIGEVIWRKFEKKRKRVNG